MGVCRCHRRMPRCLTIAIGGIGGASTGAADREHEGCILWIVRPKRARKGFKRHIPGPVQSESARRAPELIDCCRLGTRHYPEQPGMMLMERCGDREIGSERQRRVLRLRYQPRSESETQSSVFALGHLLLGWINPRSAPFKLCRLDAPRKLGKIRRQVLRLNRLISKFGGGPDHGPFDAIEVRDPVRCDTDGEDNGGSVDVRQQACSAFAQDRRVEARFAIGKIDGLASLPGFDVERTAIFDEPGNIGDGIVKEDIGTRLLDRKRLIEIDRGSRIKRDEANRGAVDMLGQPALRCGRRRCDNGRREICGHLELGADTRKLLRERAIRIDNCFHLGFMREPSTHVKPPPIATVRLIFERYVELRSIGALVDELYDRDIVTKSRTYRDGRTVGGIPFSKGPLAALLQNPIYIGKVRHRDQIHEGQHEAIIDPELFAKVQAILKPRLYRAISP